MTTISADWTRPGLAAIALLFATTSCATPPKPEVATSRSAPVALAAPFAPATPAAPSAPSLLTSRKAIAPVLDVVAARPPSARLPKGSVYVGVVLEPNEPTVFEWDVAAAKVMKQVKLPVDPDAGLRASVVRLAAAPGRVYAVVDDAATTNRRMLEVLDPELAPVARRWIGDGADVSIEANDRWVAVSLVQDRPEEPLEIVLFDAKSFGKVADTMVGANPAMTGGLRNDALELFGGRLYVKGRPLTKGAPPRSQKNGALLARTTIFALELPSLKVKATFEADHPAELPSSLTSDGEHVVLVHADALVVVSDALRLVRERPLEGSEAVFGPGGRLFTGGSYQDPEGLPGGQRESCHAAWSGAEPLLVCATDDGIFVTTDFTRRGERFWR